MFWWGKPDGQRRIRHPAYERRQPADGDSAGILWVVFEKSVEIYAVLVQEKEKAYAEQHMPFLLGQISSTLAISEKFTSKSS